MPLFKRGDAWWIDIRHGGHRTRRSAKTGNKKQAQELHDSLKAELWRENHLDELPDRTWDQAVARFLEEDAGRKGLWHDAQMLQWLTPHLSGKLLSEINDDIVSAILSKRAAVVVNRTTGQKTAAATVNRHASTLGKVLRRAIKWGWLKALPPINKRREPRERVRFLDAAEADQLIAALPEPWKACARFTLATGLRERNCTTLEWSRVNTALRMAWVQSDEMKTGTALQIPLNEDAMAILAEQKDKHPRWVFPAANGEPIDKASCATWYSALEEAEITNLHWHDLRHTWASWHVMAGTPLEVLQRLGGWKKLDMVMRYAHLAPSFVAGYAGNVKPPSKAMVTNWTHKKANAK